MTIQAQKGPNALILLVIIVSSAAFAMLVTNVIKDRQKAYQESQSTGQLSNLKCPRCAGNMETGWIVDQNRYDPKRAEWTKDPALSNNSQISAYRCVKCGHIELYANESKKK